MVNKTDVKTSSMKGKYLPFCPMRYGATYMLCFQNANIIHLHMFSTADHLQEERNVESLRAVFTSLHP